MRALLFISHLILASNCFGQPIIDSLKTKVENNQNPNNWNIDLFNKDIEWNKNNKSTPLKVIAFPVEKYDAYVFSNPFNFKIDNSNFSGISFGENIGGRKGKLEFRHDLFLIFYTKDSIISVGGDVTSRNYPYLTVQGSVNLNEQYDYVGVRSPDEKGFLMISTKAFDLQYGHTIIIFPNNNKSFYYLQLKEKLDLNEDFSKFIDKLKMNVKIVEMLKFVNVK